MNKSELKVLSILLDYFGEILTNAGCNDFQLNKCGLTDKELKDFKANLLKYNKQQDPSNNDDYINDVTFDWLIVNYLQSLIGSEIFNKTP